MAGSLSLQQSAEQRQNAPRPALRNPAVTKGRLTNIRTRYFREFMFNPTSISDQRSYVYGSHQIPGASHPVYQAGSGGERILTLQLHFDGDRGRLVRRSQGITNNDFESFEVFEEVAGSGHLSIQKDLAFYESFTYPVRPEEQGDGFVISAQAPNRAIFTMGPRYRAVEVIVESVNVNVNFWTPHMEPVRGTIDLTLKEYVRRTRFADEVFVEEVAPSHHTPLHPNEGAQSSFGVSNPEII